jgi:hypothetical protein
MTIKDYTGHRFGLLTVEKMCRKKTCRTSLFCKCDCGDTKKILMQSVISGNTLSCGCLLRRAGKNSPSYKHGGARLQEYKTWVRIKTRCYDKNNPKYPIYGGRGITVCDRWRYSAKNFMNDMGPKPSPKHSIDRIDVNGNYCKENCKWSTAAEQAMNRRIKPSTGVVGVYLDGRINKKYRARIEIDGKKKELGRFELLEDAIAARKNAEIKYWGNND